MDQTAIRTPATSLESRHPAASGETLEPFIPVETTLVTADNVDEFLTGE